MSTQAPGMTNIETRTDWPLVSAIVLCYNQARFVVECLEGIKAQDYPNLELIVNDDASTDDSVAVIEAWLAKHRDVPHQFLRSQVNQGICRSLNNALGRASGKYVSGIAADDVWLPSKLRGQVHLLEGLPERVGVVYSDAALIDESGNLLPGTFLASGVRCGHARSAPQGNVQAALWQTNFIAPMTTLVRRECYNRVGLFDESLFAEDWDMWLRISRYFEFAFAPTIAARYRMVGTSASNGQFGRLLDDISRMCVKHLKSGQLDPQVRRLAAVKLHALAISSFHQGTAGHRETLRQAWKYQPSIPIAVRLLAAACGFDSKRWKWARSLFKFKSRRNQASM